MSVEKTVERALALQERSWTLHAEGRLDDAAAACREALHLIEQAEGSMSLDVANLLNELAEIEQDRQQLAAALALAERARAIVRADTDRFADEADESRARIHLRTLARIGGIHRVQGHYADAASHLQRALVIAVATFGHAADETTEACNNLGLLYKSCGRFDEGLQLYQRALDAIIPLHGERSLDAGTLLHNIAGMLHARGDAAAAEAPGRKAWDISRDALGQEHPRTVRDAVAYAAILDALGADDECERICRWALTIFERTYGSDHEEVASTLHNLAAVLDPRGNHDEAESCYRRALAIKERLFGPDSPDAALTRNNLGKLLTTTGRRDLAIPLLQQSLSVLEQRLPPDHPHLTIVRQNLQDARDPRP